MIWDAIVIGAGPAGCAAAYDLAAAGHKVLLIDKATFPREKACAGGLTMKAVRALRYSIAPVVRKPVSDAVLEHRSGPGEQLPVSRRKPFCLMTVRSELDAFCLDQTRARGAVFRRIGGITGLEERPDRVLVFTGDGSDGVRGASGPLAARYVVGADGVHSRVRALAAERGSAVGWFRRGFALEANVPYAATGRTFPLVFDFAPVLAGYGWLFPRHDHVNVGLYTARDNTGSATPALDRERLTQYIEARCGTREHERVVGQFLGLGGASYAPEGTRVLLAGDAAGLVDPLTGEGIYGAIASGQSAAASIGDALKKGGDAASHYRRRIRSQCADLAVSEAAASAFYARPERGFRLMRVSLIRRAVLHAYSEGTSLTTLAKGVSVASRLVRSRRG